MPIAMRWSSAGRAAAGSAPFQLRVVDALAAHLQHGGGDALDPCIHPGPAHVIQRGLFLERLQLEQRLLRPPVQERGLDRSPKPAGLRCQRRRADKPRGCNTVVSVRNDLQGVMRWQG